MAVPLTRKPFFTAVPQFKIGPSFLERVFIFGPYNPSILFPKICSQDVMFGVSFEWLCPNHCSWAPGHWGHPEIQHISEHSVAPKYESREMVIRYYDSKGVLRFKGGRHLKQSQAYPKQLLGFNFRKFTVVLKDLPIDSSPTPLFCCFGHIQEGMFIFFHTSWKRSISGLGLHLRGHAPSFNAEQFVKLTDFWRRLGKPVMIMTTGLEQTVPGSNQLDCRRFLTFCQNVEWFKALEKSSCM